MGSTEQRHLGELSSNQAANTNTSSLLKPNIIKQSPFFFSFFSTNKFLSNPEKFFRSLFFDLCFMPSIRPPFQLEVFFCLCSFICSFVVLRKIMGKQDGPSVCRKNK